jgi:uncharacterized protein (UPF0333 family)
MVTNGKIVVCKYIISVKSTLGQNCQMFISIEGKKKTSWDKTAIFLSVWRQKKKATTKEQS